jgi:hypothetical protein
MIPTMINDSTIDPNALAGKSNGMFACWKYANEKTNHPTEPTPTKQSNLNNVFKTTSSL